jgi:acyl dehydratase
VIRWEDVRVGDELPAIRMGPVSRTLLALFAGASGDHNPIHVDLDFARRAGMADVFAHGMLGMAWLGRVLTGWVPQARIASFQVRFVGVTHLGHVLDCTGRVTGKDEAGGRRRVTVALRTVNQYGETKIAGEAAVELP